MRLAAKFGIRSGCGARHHAARIAALSSSTLSAAITPVTLQVADPDGSPLRFSQTGLPAGLTLNASTGTVTSGVLTLSGTPLSATATATGTAALAEFRNSSGGVIVSGLTVGSSGTDIIISSTSITSGQTVTVNSGSITHS